jgi:hypothetical protein
VSVLCAGAVAHVDALLTDAVTTPPELLESAYGEAPLYMPHCYHGIAGISHQLLHTHALTWVCACARLLSIASSCIHRLAVLLLLRLLARAVTDHRDRFPTLVLDDEVARAQADGEFSWLYLANSSGGGGGGGGGAAGDGGARATGAGRGRAAAAVSHSCACIGSPCLRHRVHGAPIGGGGGPGAPQVGALQLQLGVAGDGERLGGVGGGAAPPPRRRAVAGLHQRRRPAQPGRGDGGAGAAARRYFFNRFPDLLYDALMMRRARH